MDRLTIRNSDGSISQPLHSTFEKVFNRLAAYEDTGLTPEEIQEAVDLFKDFRNTDIPKELKSWVERCTWHVRKCNELHRELEKYRRAEAEGRLIVLPCKVGDTVWVITPDFDNTIEGVITHIEHNIYTYPVEWITVKAEFPIFGIMEKKDRIDMVLGKTVFISREEAERALKGEQDA